MPIRLCRTRLFDNAYRRCRDVCYDAGSQLMLIIMRRFILRYNIERFERALARETDPVQQKVIAELLEKARRELEALTSEHVGLS